MGIVPAKYFAQAYLQSQALVLSFSEDQPRDPNGKFASGGGGGSAADHPSVSQAVARMSMPGAHVTNAGQAYEQGRNHWLNMSKSERAPFKDAKEFAQHVENKWADNKILSTLKDKGEMDLHALASETKIPMSKYGDTRPQDAKLNAAVVRLVNSGKVEASNPRFGAPVISIKALKLALEPLFLSLSGRGGDGTFAGQSNGVGARLGSNHPSVRAAISNKAIKNARQANEYALKFYWNDKQARQDFDSARAFAYAVEKSFNEQRAYHV